MLPDDIVHEHGPWFRTERATYLYRDGYEVRFHYGGSFQVLRQAGPGTEREWLLLAIADLEALIAADRRKVEFGGGYGTLHEQLARIKALAKRREAYIEDLPPPAGAKEGEPLPPLQTPKRWEQIAAERKEQVLREEGFYEPLMEIPAHLREPEELPPAKEKS